MCYLHHQERAQLLHICHWFSPVSQRSIFIAWWEVNAWGNQHSHFMLWHSTFIMKKFEHISKDTEKYSAEAHVSSFGHEKGSLLSLALKSLLWLKHHFRISLLPLTIQKHSMQNTYLGQGLGWLTSNRTASISWIIGPDAFLHSFHCWDWQRWPFLLGPVLIPMNLNALLCMKGPFVQFDSGDPD